MIFTYKILASILYPFLYLFIYARKIIKKEDSERYKEKLLVSHFNINRKNDKKLILFHAASIGEFKSIIPIIERLNINKDKLEFLITTTTLSASNLAKIELKNISNIRHRFIPFDVEFLINKFLFLWRPNIIFLVDSEIWPNLILNSQQLKISIGLINARLTSNSLKKWMMFPKIAKRIFKVFDLFICSDSKTKNFLEKLNLKNVYFKGNIKLFGQVDAKKIKDINENYLIEKKFWFAASTHKDEDIFCINTHLKLKKKFPNISTIIAPRHVERSQKIKSLCEKFNLNAQVLNKNEVILNNKEIIIVNYFGFLHNYFKYSKSVFIGKSMVEKLKNEGGQNPIEAAKLSCKIYHGPYVSNFEEIYKILEESNISKKIYSFDELSSNLAIDLENSQKKSSEISNTISGLGEKTLNDTMQLINNFLDDVN